MTKMLKDIPINITIVKLQNTILKLRIIKKRFSVLLCATDSVCTLRSAKISTNGLH